MSNIYFTSDTHYHHKNIVRGISEWDNSRNDNNGQSTRDFKTLEEHDEAIIAGINNNVKQDDILWHLGDWSFGGIEQIWNFRKRIICENINLIYGNHDHHIENNKSLPNYNSIGAQMLFTSTQHVYFGKLGQQTFFLSHYAHRVWNKHHKGVIHGYGHSHDSLDHNGGVSTYHGKSMDVGIDSAKRILGEYRPFHIDEIIKIINKRETLIIDHHNSRTS